MMEFNMRDVLIQTAGFLTMLARGYIAVPEHARREADELLAKIGMLLKESETAE